MKTLSRKSESNKISISIYFRTHTILFSHIEYENRKHYTVITTRTKNELILQLKHRNHIIEKTNMQICSIHTIFFSLELKVHNSATFRRLFPNGQQQCGPKQTGVQFRTCCCNLTHSNQRNLTLRYVSSNV